MNYRSLLLHSCCCIVFICLNSNLCLNSSFVNSFEIAKGFLFPFFSFPASGPIFPAQPSWFARPSSPFQPLQPSQLTPRGPLQPASSPPPCVADRWGPVVIPDLRPDPKPNPTVRCGRVASPARPRLLPWARTPRRPGMPIRAAATSYPTPFAPTRVTLATPRRLKP
jgi:hypothetical protein